MIARGRWLAAAVAIAVTALPSPVWACSVCFWGKSNSMVAYVGTAVLLSVLPLGLIGGIGLWLRQRARTR